MSFRERRQKSHSTEGSHDSPPSHSAVPKLTHIHSAVEKDPELKTIEELKDPKLASYPILDPKTVESIQSNAKEDADRDMKNLKRIVDPDVEVPKDLPQREKDPFIVPEDGSPLAGKAAKPDAKHPSWMRRNVLLLWSLTKKGTKQSLSCNCRFGYGTTDFGSFTCCWEFHCLSDIMCSCCSSCMEATQFLFV